MLTGCSASRSADPTARAASSIMSAAGRTPGAATCRRRPAARAKLPKRRSTCSAAKDSSTYSSATRTSHAPVPRTPATQADGAARAGAVARDGPHGRRHGRADGGPDAIGRARRRRGRRRAPAAASRRRRLALQQRVDRRGAVTRMSRRPGPSRHCTTPLIDARAATHTRPAARPQ